jgi:hypothetical protein
MKPTFSGSKLIVVTGGPGAGKTAVLEIARRSVCRHVSVLPEAASIIFQGGFPRRLSESGRLASQQAIFHVQRALEASFLGEGQWTVGLCDRGTIDGLAYWPGTEEQFWKMAGTTRAEEYARYAAVIHLRTPSSVDGYNHENPMRIETNVEAQQIDLRLEQAWVGHPNRLFIDRHESFFVKATLALELIKSQLPRCCD